MSEVASAAPAAPAAAPAAAPVAPVAEAKAPAANEALAKEAVAAVEKEKAAPAVEPPRKYKVKVDDAEMEVDEDELRRGYQTSKAADKRFREAAETKKAAEAHRAEVSSVIELMQKDPAEFSRRAEKLGINPVELAEGILRPLIEAQMAADAEKEMTPEQLEAHQTKKELAAYKAREAEAKRQEAVAAQQRQEAEQSAATTRQMDELGAIITGALKETKLPQTYETSLELANLLEETIQRGIPVDAKTLARDLESRKRQELRAVANRDTIPDDLRKSIMEEALNDPEIMAKLRKKDVEEYKKNNPMAAAKPLTGPSSEKAAEKPKRTSFGSVMRELQLSSSKR